MNRICIVVPTYPPHYLFAKGFMDSFVKYEYEEQADLYFVFTNPAERDGFLPCNAIVLPKKLRVMKNRGIINIKKFYALMQLKNKYDYIIALDDESVFTKAVDLQEICDTYFENKVLYGNILENPSWDIMGQVAEHCKEFFSKEDRGKLSCPLYLWFSQLPIYRTDTLSDFFRMTKIGNNIAKLSYFDYDYYIYMYYLMLKYDFQAEDMGVISNQSVIELTHGVQYRVYNEQYKHQRIFMATEYARRTLGLDEVFINIHMDRDITAGKQPGKISKVCTAIKAYCQIRKHIL